MLRKQLDDELPTSAQVTLGYFGDYNHVDRVVGLFHRKLAQIIKFQTQYFSKIPNPVQARK